MKSPQIPPRAFLPERGFQDWKNGQDDFTLILSILKKAVITKIVADHESKRFSD
jgi:hypothetical protein